MKVFHNEKWFLNDDRCHLFFIGNRFISETGVVSKDLVLDKWIVDLLTVQRSALLANQNIAFGINLL